MDTETSPIIRNIHHSDGAVINDDGPHPAEEKGRAEVSHSEQMKSTGIGVGTCAFFVMGEVAGAGVLALPMAVEDTSWVGLLLIVASCVAAGYNGTNLGRCWMMLLERYTEFRDSHVRYPYPAIGEKAVGRWMRIVVSAAINLTLFFGATVMILIASQNIQSLLENYTSVRLTFCVWLAILAAVMLPFTWFGSPKDFWPVAIGAFAATLVACVLIFVSMMLDIKHHPHVDHNNPTFQSIFLAFGTMLFAFGGASTFPTLQHDMKDPRKFGKSVVIAYSAIVSIYIAISGAGYFIYGSSVQKNVLQSIPKGVMRMVAEICITGHLMFAFIIIINPVSQEVENILRVPKHFTWKRCIVRTVIVAGVLFVGETFPHFGALLNLIGGSTITFLTFVAPSLFYLRLSSMTGDWEARPAKFHEKVINIILIVVGLAGGVASTYSAIQDIASPDTFIPPCYVNATAASSKV